MKKRKFVKTILLILIPIIIVFGIASVFSYSYFGVINPIASGVGLIKVKMMDTTLVEVQKSPKVIFFKSDYYSSDYSIVKVMEEHGYTFFGREGMMLYFEKDNIKYRGIGWDCTFDGGIVSFWRADNSFPNQSSLVLHPKAKNLLFVL